MNLMFKTCFQGLAHLGSYALDLGLLAFLFTTDSWALRIISLLIAVPTLVALSHGIEELKKLPP